MDYLVCIAFYTFSTILWRVMTHFQVVTYVKISENWSFLPFFTFFGPTPTGGIRTYKFSLVSVFCFLFSVFFCFFLFSPSPHFSRNPRIRFFWFFASTLVSGNVKRWRFWIFEENSKFGHFGQFLVKNGQFWPKWPISPKPRIRF